MDNDNIRPTNPLQEKLAEIRLALEKKHWHISNTPHISAGITGMVTNQKTKKSELRSQLIVGIWNIHSVQAEGERRMNMWEVKTHWTVKRNIFSEFNPAWEMFCTEAEKYHPEEINWSKLDSQEKL